jgi:hypothetical protein
MVAQTQKTINAAQTNATIMSNMALIAFSLATLVMRRGGPGVFGMEQVRDPAVASSTLVGLFLH